LIEFEDRLKQKGLATMTIYYKIWNLKAFLNSINERALTATTEEIEGYLRYCFNEDYSTALYNHRIRDLKQFYDLLLDRELILLNPVDGIVRKEKEEPRRCVFTEDEVKRIIDAIPDTPRGRRDRAIIELVYSTGLRIGELMGLDLEDVDVGTREIVVRQGKGGRERIVPVGREALIVLERYLADRLEDTFKREHESLFLNCFGRRPGKHGLEWMFEQKKRAAGVKTKGNLHALRHSFASHLCAHGAPLELIRRMLGHRRLDSTHEYTHITKQTLRRVFKSSHPKA
jgi:site-specific recombinase XerD